eukprot:Gregarina_sp_Poly_1__10290@NODE_723_length_6600_cov_64_797949_g543_i0_p3_GENE_NODE_723_length_6600_cov_64_797949_g543_i0NODE_723_length_6600_cov_64_797949_g543_i0_p3_ORF_typecomplete_len180_score27_92_NODE_723_length_6600_cov_64_797949_g543_i051965735
MKFVLLPILLVISGVPEKLKSWIKKSHKDLDMTLNLGRNYSQILDEATDPLVVVLPTNKAWGSNKGLYDKIKDNEESITELMLSIAIMLLDEKSVPTSVDAILKIQKEQNGQLETVAGTPVRVSRKEKNVLVSWLKVKADGSVKPEGKPVKIDPKPIILEDAAIFKALNISLPRSSGIF